VQSQEPMMQAQANRLQILTWYSSYQWSLWLQLAMEKCHLEGGMAQLALDPMPATFEKPEEKKRRHLKALFLKGQVDGRHVTKLLVDGGAAVNIRPYAMFRKLGKGEEDLIKTDMMLKDFEGNVSPARGALCVDLTIGSKTLPTTFFVVNGKGSYNLLLGRDWIHANCCIPSTMQKPDILQLKGYICA
jgi:hypothetical protein